jgi:prepilin-type N-terminal cleavage/methylation domain-containing protein
VMKHIVCKQRQLFQGFTLIEVLVAMAISAVGLLGFLSMHSHMVAADTETSRQAKAVELVQYMSAQVQAYPTLGPYCGNTIVVSGSSFSCDQNNVPEQNFAAMTETALTTWQSLIFPVNVDGSADDSALPNALGCITYNSGEDTYTVSIGWSGSLSSLEDSSLTCGASESGNRTLTYSVVVNQAL